MQSMDKTPADYLVSSILRPQLVKLTQLFAVHIDWSLAPYRLSSCLTRVLRVGGNRLSATTRWYAFCVHCLSVVMSYSFYNPILVCGIRASTSAFSSRRPSVLTLRIRVQASFKVCILNRLLVSLNVMPCLSKSWYPMHIKEFDLPGRTSAFTSKRPLVLLLLDARGSTIFHGASANLSRRQVTHDGFYMVEIFSMFTLSRYPGRLSYAHPCECTPDRLAYIGESTPRL